MNLKNYLERVKKKYNKKPEIKSDNVVSFEEALQAKKKTDEADMLSCTYQEAKIAAFEFKSKGYKRVSLKIDTNSERPQDKMKDSIQALLEEGYSAGRIEVPNMYSLMRDYLSDNLSKSRIEEFRSKSSNLKRN